MLSILRLQGLVVLELFNDSSPDLLNIDTLELHADRVAFYVHVRLVVVPDVRKKRVV
jgi:hypothetical protein